MKLTTKDKKEMRIWLKALRSGKFKQTTHCLQDDEGFCCLGVACKVLIPDHKQIKPYGYLKGEMPSAQKIAPKWLKKINKNMFKILDIEIVQLNDTIGYKFEEIADVIEATYLMEPNYKSLLKYVEATGN